MTEAMGERERVVANLKERIVRSAEALRFHGASLEEIESTLTDAARAANDLTSEATD